MQRLRRGDAPVSGSAWGPREIARFLAWTGMRPAREIAARLGRSLPAINGMRRKLKRLQELGATSTELARLLAVNEDLILQQGLRQIRIRAGEPLVQIRHYLRRGRVTGRPHLVDEHVRLPVEKTR